MKDQYIKIKTKHIWTLHFILIATMLAASITVDLNGCIFGLNSMVSTIIITLNIAYGIPVSIILIFAGKNWKSKLFAVLSLLFYFSVIIPAVAW